jgi:dipeptide transport system substrate-binding protein
VKDERVIAVRNDDYWGDKPYLDKVTIRPFPDPQARVIALQAGEIHFTADITPEQTETLRKDTSLVVIAKNGNSNTFIGFNVLKKPFDDVRVRQALNYAIDKNAIVKSIYNGDAVALNGMASPNQIGFSDTTGFPYNPTKAKELLAQAGLSAGFSTELLSSTRYPKDLELMQFVQQQLKEVGVTAKITQKEFAAFLEDLRNDPRNSPVQMWRDGRGGSNVGDYWLSTYGCDAFRPAGANTNGSCDTSIDAIAKQAVATVDEKAYNDLAKQIQDKSTPLAYSIWLFLAKNVVATSSKLHDPVVNVNGVFSVGAKTWLEP